MTITMKFDAPALRALIKEDEKFELELQSAVIQEITRGMFSKSVPQHVRDMVDEDFKKQKQELTQAISDDVGFRAQIDKALSAMVQSIRSSTGSYASQRSLTEEVKRLINGHIAQMVEDQVNKQKDALSASVDAMIMRLEKQFEKAIEEKLERMDRAYHDIAHRAVMEKFKAFATN